jgi:hypothetical protein
MKGYDLALVGDETTGNWVAHTIDCPAVHAARAQEKPIGTLLGCQKMPDDSLERHACLDNVENARSVAG